MQIVELYATLTPKSCPVSLATRGCTSSYNKIAIIIGLVPNPDKAVMKPMQHAAKGRPMTFLSVQWKSPVTNSYPICFLYLCSFLCTQTAIRVIIRLAIRSIAKRDQSIAVHLVESIIEASYPEPRKICTRNNISTIPSIRPNFLGYQFVLSFLITNSRS